MNMPLVLLNRRRRGSVAFSPVSLFSAGEQGFWLEPSDLTTMFQDRAGTTPVTTPGQTVGLRLDKSKGLTLGAELVTNGDFSSGTGWTLGTGWAVSGGQATFTATGANSALTTVATAAAVSGRTYEIRYTVVSNTLNAGALRLGGFSSASYSSAFQTLPSTVGNQIFRFQSVPSGVGTVLDFWVTSTATSGSITIDNISVKELLGNHAVAPTDAARPTYGIEPKTGRRNLLLATDTMATQSLTVTAVAHTLAFTGTGTVTLTGASIAGPLIGTGASNRVSLTFTPTAASLTLTVVGSVTLAQLEVGSTATAYQRVGTAFDVTEAGVPTVHYVQYDGVDDSFATPTITPGIDKAQVFAGVRKLSDAARGIIAEFGPDGQPGRLILQGPSANATSNYGFSSFGSTFVSTTTPQSYAAPITNVITGLGDISGDLATLYANGTQVAQSVANQGTGNYLAYPLYIGRRGGTLLPFNGRDYGLIVRFGANLDASTITATETYLASKTSEVTL